MPHPSTLRPPLPAAKASGVRRSHRRKEKTPRSPKAPGCFQYTITVLNLSFVPKAAAFTAGIKVKVSIIVNGDNLTSFCSSVYDIFARVSFIHPSGSTMFVSRVTEADGSNRRGTQETCIGRFRDVSLGFYVLLQIIHDHPFLTLQNISYRSQYIHLSGGFAGQLNRASLPFH